MFSFFHLLVTLSEGGRGRGVVRSSLNMIEQLIIQWNHFSSCSIIVPEFFLRFPRLHIKAASAKKKNLMNGERKREWRVCSSIGEQRRSRGPFSGKELRGATLSVSQRAGLRGPRAHRRSEEQVKRGEEPPDLWSSPSSIPH